MPWRRPRRKRWLEPPEHEPDALVPYDPDKRLLVSDLDPRALKFILRIESEALPIGPVLAKLSAPIMPAALDFVTDALNDFYINDFALQAVYEGGDYQATAKGSPSFMPSAYMEVQVGKLEEKRIAAGVIIIRTGDVNSFNQLLSATGGGSMDFKSMPVAPSNAGTTIYGLLSQTELDLVENPDWRWQAPELANEPSIPKGLTLAADFGFPADCKNDTVCITFKGFIGSARLRVYVSVREEEFAVGAALVNLKINDKLTLNKAGLEMVISKTPKFVVFGEMAVVVNNGTTLTFGVEVAAIFVPPKVEFKGYMIGMWTNAFGNPRLAVGNLVIGLGVSATSPVAGLPMPSILVGGEIMLGLQPCYGNNLPPPRIFRCATYTTSELAELGNPNSDNLNGGPGSTLRKICAADPTRQYTDNVKDSPCSCKCCEMRAANGTARCVSGAGYVGIDPADSKKNWFGIRLRNMVLKNIFTALMDSPPDLPPVLADTGFPGILTFSFSPLQSQEPLRGVSFPKGIYFNGSFNFLGLRGRAQLSWDPDDGVLADVALAPLTIGGDIFVLQRNRTAPNDGAFVYIDARGIRRARPVIQGSAFLSLFGGAIGAEVIVDIAVPNNFRVSASTNFFGLSANLSIAASLASQGWASMGVSASVGFGGLDLITKFVSRVTAAISGWCQEAANALADAQRSVTNAKAEVDRTLTSGA
ncbi:hypothetical protein DFJ74DRAFT_689558 [Hyaloraphidium curvatum]|nr:hypothetical protein DFJ74DRAFT_689558 [Hyaloraphidium curvatum]